MTELPVPVEQVKVLRLEPDDRLVVETDEPVDREEWSYVRDEIAAWAGIEPERVLVMVGAKLRTLSDEERGF